MNWKALSHLSIKKIESLQDKYLKYFVQHKVPFSPYYNKLFKKNNIKYSDIKTTKDLKKIPFTTKKDIAPDKKNPKKYNEFVLQADFVQDISKMDKFLYDKVKSLLS